MKDFLLKQAGKKFLSEHKDDFIVYQENLSHGANDGTWLTTKTSYIWKIAVLCVIDSNKRDYAHIFIGQQRTDKHDPEFLGSLYFSDGENDDPGRSLIRILACLQKADILFDPD